MVSEITEGVSEEIEKSAGCGLLVNLLKKHRPGAESRRQSPAKRTYPGDSWDVFSEVLGKRRRWLASFYGGKAASPSGHGLGPEIP